MEYLESELRLERLHLLRDGGLGNPQSIRSPAEMQLFRRDHERLKVPEVHFEGLFKNKVILSKSLVSID
nr:hypothetical protein [Paraburkholderia sp. MMS20-SJTR3]